MSTFKVFIKERGCPKCHKVLQHCNALKEKGLNFQVYDLETVNGLAETSYYGILSVPTIIEVDSEDNEIKRWMGLEELIKFNQIE